MTIAAIAAPRTRARASNNPRRLEGLDGRSAQGRRRRDVIDGFVAALGGPDCVNDAMMSDLARAADLTILAARARENHLLGGTQISVSHLIRLEGAADRAVRRLNLPSDGTSLSAPTLADIFSVPDDDADEADAE
jgi:hypothetical protein